MYSGMVLYCTMDDLKYVSSNTPPRTKFRPYVHPLKWKWIMYRCLLWFLFTKINDRAHFSMYLDASCVHVTFAGDAVESGEERAGAARASRLAAWGAGHIEGLRARSQRA